MMGKRFIKPSYPLIKASSTRLPRRLSMVATNPSPVPSRPEQIVMMAVTRIYLLDESNRTYSILDQNPPS